MSDQATPSPLTPASGDRILALAESNFLSVTRFGLDKVG